MRNAIFKGIKFNKIQLKQIWNRSSHINASGIDNDKVSDADGSSKHSYYDETMKTGFTNPKAGDEHTDRSINNKSTLKNVDKQDLSMEGTKDSSNIRDFNESKQENAKYSNYFSKDAHVIGTETGGTSVYKEQDEVREKAKKDAKIVEDESDKGTSTNENLKDSKDDFTERDGLSMTTFKKGKSFYDFKPDLDTENNGKMNLGAAKTTNKDDIRSNSEKNYNNKI